MKKVIVERIRAGFELEIQANQAELQRLMEQMWIRNILPRIIDEIVVTARRERRLEGVRINFELKYPDEQIWIVLTSGAIQNVPTTTSKEKATVCNKVVEVGRNSYTLPEGVDVFAVIHTHPNWGSAWPGPEDYGMASKRRTYNINQDSAWVLPRGAARGSAPQMLSGRSPKPPQGC